MKKLLSVILSVLCLLVGVCFVSCGKIAHNAAIVNDGVTYKTEWLENNYTYGAYKNGGKEYDETSPKSRTYILKNQAELDEVFEDFPEIDFEKEMVLVHCYTSVYGRKRVLERVELNENILIVEFNVVKGKFGYADASAPQRRVVAIRLDNLDISEAQIAYNGQ